MVDGRTLDSPEPPIDHDDAKTAKPETRFATDALHMRPLQQSTKIVSLAYAHLISAQRRKTPKSTQQPYTSEFSMQSRLSTTLLQSSLLLTELSTVKTFHQTQSTNKCFMISGLAISPSKCTFHSRWNPPTPFPNSNIAPNMKAQPESSIHSVTT